MTQGDLVRNHRPGFKSIALLLAVIIAGLTLSTLTQQETPRVRGLLSVPTNLLTSLSPEVCNSSGLTLATGATIDAGTTHGSCGSIKLPTATVCPITGDPLANAQTGLQTTYNFTDGSFRGECPQTLGSSFLTGTYPVAPGDKMTFSAYLRSAGTYAGDLDVIIQAFTSTGAPAAVDVSGSNTVIYDDWTNSAANPTNPWEESLIWFTVPTGVAFIRIYGVRFFPSTAPLGDMWVDDLYLGPGWVHREEDAAKVAFPGTVASTDSLGNISVKRTTGGTAGTQEPFFPIAVAPSGTRTDWSFYSGIGFNTIWTSAVFDYQASSDWSALSTSNPLARAKRATSAALPDGMRVMLDESIPIRGAFNFEWLNPTTHAPCTPYSVGCGGYGASDWNSTLPTAMSTALTQIVSHGYADQLLGIIDDAEAKTSRRNRDRALNSLIDSTDRSLNSGQRRWPVISNMGLPGGARAARLADNTTPYPALVGTYMAANSAGPLAKMAHEHNQVVPAGYCQVQSGLGWYRQFLYRCLGLGGKMFALWADSPNTDVNAAGSQGLHLETEAGFADFDELFAEVPKLMPLIRQPLPDDWFVSSSNANVEVFARSYAGKAYVFVINKTYAAQSTTLTFTGAGSVTSLVQYGWSTGVPDSGTTTVGSGLTLTVPGIGAAGSVGGGGGTMVLRAVGSSVATTTTPGSTTTVATTTTVAPSTSSFDDPTGTYSPTSSAEATGWVQYGPSLPAAVGDYLLGNHVTSLAGATATKTFTGTRIGIYGATGPYDGQFSVSIDGAAPSNVGCANPVPSTTLCEAYSASDVRQTLLWQSPVLTSGSHTIVLTVSGSRNSSSAGNYVVIDRFDTSATGGGATTTTTTSTTSTTTTAPSSRVVTIDAFVDTNRNGVLNSGEARMVRTKWRVVNSSGAVIASGLIVRSVTVSVPSGTGYAVKFFPPLRATSPVTVAIPSSGAVTIRVGGCCPTVFNRRT